MAFGKGGKRVDKRKGVKREIHNIPDELDLKIWEDEFKKLSKPLDANGKRKPITETELIGWIRKKLDDVWMKCPTKLSFLASKRVPDYSPDTRRASIYVCSMCEDGFSGTDVQVDHIEGEHEFTKLSQLVEFANKRFMVGYNDLQILCIPCHQLKTHAERQGLSLAEARADKEAIAICKAKQDKQWLIDRGIKPESNAAKRKVQVRQELFK
jgi:hypothetical protein